MMNIGELIPPKPGPSAAVLAMMSRAALVGVPEDVVAKWASGELKTEVLLGWIEVYEEENANG